MNQFIDYIGLFVFLYPAIMAVYWGSTGLMYFLKQEKLSRNKKFADYPNYKYHTDAPLVSLLVPCYNEADNIDESLPFLLKSNYPNLEIILVNDGSKDDTAQYIKRWSQAHPNIYAYYQKNSGKATALNQVLKYARGKYVVCIDGDSILDMDAIDFLVHALENNPEFVAVTGNPRVRNRSTLLGRLQVAEFSSIIGLIKRSQSILGSIFTVSGVVCAFRREALIEVGGWSKDMITEDIDISWKLQVEGNRIGYEPRALCWVLMPETIRGLYKQRLRWAQGGAEVFLKYFRQVFRWRNRKMWHLYIEYIISALWAYSLAALTLLATISLIRDTSQFYPFLVLSSFFLIAIFCLQMAVSLYIDSHYEHHLKRYFISSIWYPYIYWILNALTLILGIPKAILRDKEKLAVWTSPDRGIR